MHQCTQTPIDAHIHLSTYAYIHIALIYIIIMIITDRITWMHTYMYQYILKSSPHDRNWTISKSC
jgi:hypothetical protein